MVWCSNGSEVLSNENQESVLSDKHMTLSACLEHAREMHALAEEMADQCYDTSAATLSQGAAMIEMLVSELRGLWRDYGTEKREIKGQGSRVGDTDYG